MFGKNAEVDLENGGPMPGVTVISMVSQKHEMHQDLKIMLEGLIGVEVIHCPDGSLTERKRIITQSSKKNKLCIYLLPLDVTDNPELIKHALTVNGGNEVCVWTKFERAAHNTTRELVHCHRLHVFRPSWNGFALLQDFLMSII